MHNNGYNMFQTGTVNSRADRNNGAAGVDRYAQKRVRKGKTQKDRANNAAQRADSNRTQRANYTTWCGGNVGESRGATKEQAAAKWDPIAHTCNGNGNSSNRRPDRKPGKKVK